MPPLQIRIASTVPEWRNQIDVSFITQQDPASIPTTGSILIFFHFTDDHGQGQLAFLQCILGALQTTSVRGWRLSFKRWEWGARGTIATNKLGRFYAEVESLSMFWKGRGSPMSCAFSHPTNWYGEVQSLQKISRLRQEFLPLTEMFKRQKVGKSTFLFRCHQIIRLH